MPTYHYQCRNCGYDFTVFRTFEQGPLTQCPQCKTDQIHQIYSAVPVEFKGSGFYSTDKGGKK